MNTTRNLPAEASRHESTRWGPERRLEFIDFRLRWEGKLNRSDLVAFFGISIPQASLDIARYLELAPTNAVYDKSIKGYFATNTFSPLYRTNEPARYLNELLASATEVLQAESSFIGWTPPVLVSASPTRTLSANTLICLLGSIRRARAVKVLYQSMSSVEPKERVIAPHALAYDGFRWHARAFCNLREKFIDFVIARILSIQGLEEPGTDGASDEAWHHPIRLVLAPNPALSSAHQRVLELDYGMTEGEVILECRQALLFYTLKRLGLLDSGNAAPEVQQIVLRNIDEIRAYLPTSNEPR